MRQSVGVDVGGTFTDIAVWDGSRIVVGKVPSTTDDQSKAIVAGALGVADPTAELSLLHGTTVATNALLERRGAKTLLVTDAGFESAIDIGRQARPSLYDSFADRAEPLTGRDLRVGVEVSAESTATEVTAEAQRVAALVSEAEVEAVAICLLNSFEDPTAERALRDALAAMITVPISISTDVAREFREYERMSTTVLNAFLTPEVAKYMTRLDSRATGAGFGSRVAVIRSSGGLTSTAAAAKVPTSILLSGPAGGVVAAAELGRLTGHGTLISFDMGGTSTDVCLIESGTPDVTFNREIEGHACLMPSVAVHTVGAGGGSVAWIDSGGGLRVGPRSAGANPGPACYRRGGTEPTVTDANLVLGRLAADTDLASGLSLDRGAAVAAFEPLSATLDLSVKEVAAGVLAIVESHMAGAIRAVSIEDGVDPRDAMLVAFGGAGGLHASSLASELGMAGVLVPPYAGVFSAFGLLQSPPRSDVALTVNLTEARFGELADRAQLLASKALSELASSSGQEPSAEVLVADMRYVGQSHEVTVACSASEPWAVLRERFDSLHSKRNGFSRPGDAVEVVTLRASALGTKVLDWADLGTHAPDGGDPLVAIRNVHESGADVEASVWRRSSLPVGRRVDGPAVVVEPESTTYVGSDEVAVVHATGALEITWQQ